MREGGAETQDRSLEAGTDEEAMEERYYRCASYGLFSLLSFTIQDYLPRGDITHTYLDTSISIAD